MKTIDKKEIQKTATTTTTTTKRQNGARNRSYSERVRAK